MPESKKTVDSKVSEKSTKQAMWNAYNELLQKIDWESLESHPKQKEIETQNTLKSLSELKSKISQNLDKIGEELLKDLNDLQEFKNNISKEKQQMIANYSEQQNILEKEIKKMKEYYEQEKKNYQVKFDEELRQKTVARHREEDEYQYNLSLIRRDEQDEYNHQKLIQEKHLDERKQIMGDREKAIKEMERELAFMPEKINQAVKEACGILTKELTEKSEREKRDNRLAYENELKITELRKSALENTVKSQLLEIENLKKQLSEANRQFKEIAVSVIEGHSASVQTQVVDKT